MKWTAEQYQAISLRNKNILVSAAAGSGKTAVLVERIIRLILEEGVSLGEMLVVTFSNAAASEMKEKIITAITKKMEEDDVNDSVKRFLRNQLDAVHRANISTFHAFSMEVIRRYFHLIDIEPNFKICDEAQKDILQAEAMEDLFSGMFASNDEEFLSFLKKYAGSKSENTVKEMIRHTHGFIQSIPDPFPWLLSSVQQLSMPEEDFRETEAYRELTVLIGREMDLALSYLHSASNLLAENGVESLAKKAENELVKLDEIYRRLKSRGPDEVLNDLSLFSFERFVAVKAEKEVYETIKDEVKALRDKGKGHINKITESFGMKPFSQYIEEMNDTHRDGMCLYRLVWEFDRIYREKKAKKMVIDFSDIEHYALVILNHDDAAEEYRKKFRYLFIDEYQDSNIVQETLISKIKGPNNLFMVGDVKQSIYKFRLAEPELFIEKYESFKAAGPLDEKVDLNRNFRSKGNIIQAINSVFAAIMSKSTTGMDYDDDAALYKGTSYDGILDYPVSLHIVDDKKLEDEDLDGEIKEMKKAQVEAYTAVRLIREARGKLIYDGKKEAVRPLENRDIVILLRAVKGHGDVYFETLMDAGIPAYIDNSDGYFDTVEIQVFLNLLRIIDNKRQDIPLLSVLRSPVFGLTIDEIARIRIERKQGSYCDAFLAYCELGSDPFLKQKCQDALGKLNRWSKRASYIPLEDLLWDLILETGYYEYVGAIPAGTQRQANLRALVDKAVAYQNSQMKGLFGFINYIEALQKGKVSTGQVKLVGENDNVVRIMSVHKSKGLEFPYVLVGGLGKKFRFAQDVSSVTFHKDIGMGLRYVAPDGNSYRKTVLQQLIEQKKRREDLAEEIRILYVAFTRAMDELVLLGTCTDLESTLKKYGYQNRDFVAAAGSYLDMIYPACAEGADVNIFTHDRSLLSVEKRQEQKGEEDIKRSVLRGFLKEAEEKTTRRRKGSKRGEETEPGAALFVDEEIERRLSYRYPFEMANRMKSKYSVSELARLSLGRDASRSPEATTGSGTYSYEMRSFNGLAERTITEETFAAGEGDKLKPAGELTLVKPEEEQLSMGIPGMESDMDQTVGKNEIRSKEEQIAEDKIFTAAGNTAGKNAYRNYEMPSAIVPRFMQERQSLTAAERGTALHRVMELIPFEQYAGSFEKGGIESFVKSLVERELLTPEQAEVVDVNRVAAFFRSEIGRRASRADHVFKEVSFNLERCMEGEKIVIQGTIDCYFRENGKYILLDYKSDYAQRNEDFLTALKEQHRPQVELYREALEKIRGIKIDEMYLYLFSLGEGVLL